MWRALEGHEFGGPRLVLKVFNTTLAATAVTTEAPAPFAQPPPFMNAAALTDPEAPSPKVLWQTCQGVSGSPALDLGRQGVQDGGGRGGDSNGWFRLTEVYKTGGLRRRVQEPGSSGYWRMGGGCSGRRAVAKRLEGDGGRTEAVEAGRGTPTGVAPSKSPRVGDRDKTNAPCNHRHSVPNTQCGG